MEGMREGDPEDNVRNYMAHKEVRAGCVRHAESLASSSNIKVEQWL